MSHHHAKSASLIHINWIFTFSPINWPVLSCWPASEGFWENREAFPFYFPPTAFNGHRPERGSIFLFFPSLLQRSAISLKAYDICWSQSLCGEKTVCVLLSWSLYSLLTCLRRCQGPWGEKPDVQWVTQIPCSQRTDHKLKENNPVQSCSASTKTRTGVPPRPRHFAAVIWYIDTCVLFQIVPKGAGSLTLCGPNRRKIWVDLLNLNFKGGVTHPLVNHRWNTHIWRANCVIQSVIINKLLMVFVLRCHGD